MSEAATGARHGLWCMRTACRIVRTVRLAVASTGCFAVPGKGAYVPEQHDAWPVGWRSVGRP